MNAPISTAGYVVEPLPIPSLPVKGSDKLFPVILTGSGAPAKIAKSAGDVKKLRAARQAQTEGAQAATLGLQGGEVAAKLGMAQAAQTAARAGVRTLVLTHYVPPLIPGDEEAWRALAAAHFGGEVVLGDDLTTVAADGAP